MKNVEKFDDGAFEINAKFGLSFSIACDGFSLKMSFITDD